MSDTPPAATPPGAAPAPAPASSPASSPAAIAQPPVLVLGARSDIAMALAHAYGDAGHPLMLAARDAARLEPDRADLILRHGIEVSLHDYDAEDPDPAAFFDRLPARPGIAISAVGLMPSQAEAEADPALAARVVAANFTGPALALSEAARRMAAAGGGTIIGISSVAGDRGRAKNWWYGAAKAGLTAALSGLRQQHHAAGVRVLCVRPGFVATRMTEGMDLIPALTDAPRALAARIKAAADAGQAAYTPWKWRLVMGVITRLPDIVFRRLKF